MELSSVLRRWHDREHLPIREIERRTKLSRNTIRKYLRAETAEVKFKVPERPSRLDPFSEKLEGLLRRAGGDREMAEILALVLHHDEQAVLCAIELALEERGGHQNPRRQHAAPPDRCQEDGSLQARRAAGAGAGARAPGRYEAV